MRDLVWRAAEEGITDFGISDHLHTAYNLPDIEASRQEYLACHPRPRFHFGIEVSCVSQWELDEIAMGKHDRPVYGLRGGGPPGGAMAIGMTRADIERLGIEYVVAGAHWPLYVPLERRAVIEDYHRQNVFLACHELVDIVAHPWWWMGHWQDADHRYTTGPWLDDFAIIPRSMHDEFVAAAVQHGTAVEINLEAMLLNALYSEAFIREYLEYLAYLQGRCVRLSIGSDCHDGHYAFGLQDQRLRPLGGGEAFRTCYDAINGDWASFAPTAEEQPNSHYSAGLEKAAALLDSVGIDDNKLWRLPPREG